MTRDDAGRVFTSGVPRAVDVASIEDELVQVWKSAAVGPEDGEPSAVTRASLLNLVVHTRGAAEGAAATATVTAVCREIPCRALVVNEDLSPSASRPPLEAWISAHCQPVGPDRRQVCCEQVTIRAASEALESLPSTVLALLIPDLPTALWWPGDADPDAALLRHLAGAVDRLIVDSSGFEPAGARFERLAAWRAAHPWVEVCDVNWERLAGWRELAAGLFDAPPFDSSLAALDAVEFEHGERGAAAATLCAGWLASRLDWKPAGRDRGGTHLLQGASGPVRLGFTPGTGGGAGLRRLTLHDTSRRTRFVFEPDTSHSGLLVARIDCPGTRPLPVRLALGRLDPDALLGRILQRAHRNQACEEALETAAILSAS